MKKQILNLGKALSKYEQKQISGGECVNVDPIRKTSTIGECDPNSIYSTPL
ncbi:hypothetical protein C7447_101951 [Tenacibaculum adriaticum]|uniref:Uncharacterized protein n=1 Tax=Tenacibaculum adriaticum TaxID=413713 RepID=A0A5S5DYL7_9FLAO|nr:hypothetical protein [Tenacibaculum adriaticum]TYQ00339.1 hypothetical protein C7447_101951 [Tenacibaculum adriaticum]